MRVRCLTDDQIEEMAVAGEKGAAKVERHTAECEKCRSRLETALQNERLVKQLRELRESRARIAHLIPVDPTTLLPPR